ncbi:MAG: CSLREA domain-containing protein [Ectothiorhodospiraceae bacterium]|jgi:hypothetical protein|nr:CSLREA domain-containing protein [Ectothiorhodospiraceae bacterium]
MRSHRLVRQSILAFVALCGFLPVLATAATITVTGSADDTLVNLNGNGTCDLREAIEAANTNVPVGECTGDAAGADTIAFNIPGAGPHFVEINGNVNLPPITTVVHIDGYTQPGSSANTNASGAINADLRVGIRRTAGTASLGLSFAAGSDGSSVRGLVIGGFGSSGIQVFGSTDVTIAGNFLGTDATGTLDQGSSDAGVLVMVGADRVTIGGAAPADRNLIAGNNHAQIMKGGNGFASDITIRNNLIGIQIDGNTPLFGDYGIRQWAGGGMIQDNVIGAALTGIAIYGQGTNYVIANRVGVGADGASAIGGSQFGVTIEDGGDNLAPLAYVGSDNPAHANIIANWGQSGIQVRHVEVAAAQPRATILQNSIYDNGGLGIELVDEANGDVVGVTVNDGGDADVGPNGYQNFPVITSAVTDGASTTVHWTLNSTPNTAIWIEAFSNPTCHASGYGEGRTVIASVSAGMTNGAGNLSGVINVPPVALGHFITMTASNSAAFETSEFSACQMVMAQSVDAPVLSPVGLALMSALLALTGGLSRRIKGLA